MWRADERTSGRADARTRAHCAWLARDSEDGDEHPHALLTKLRSGVHAGIVVAWAG